MAQIKSLGYNVEVGKKCFSKISSFMTKHTYSSYTILCDENTLQHCLPHLITSCPDMGGAQIIEIESGETSKSLEICNHIWQTLIENNADRKSLLINLGGGVVSDLGGFCASVYKRGIDFINIPTSLLAMADASIGGKTGINLSLFKNSIGTFTQPKAVFVNPLFLQSLPQKHFENGLAEIYKIALVADASLWQELKTQKHEKNIEALINKSIGLKNKIVLKDPYDGTQRKILNFGHTIGHALETQALGTTNEILHGEAVIMGMIIESHIAYQKKILPKSDFTEISTELSKRITYNAPKIVIPKLLELIKNDKKSTHKKVQFSLVNKIGSCLYNVEVSETQISKALAFYANIVHVRN
jgi:3-dehydroquinate synthase